ncbi:MAG: type II secretion system minor pseudopilin GspK [Desulfuromonadales bacterium]|nr:type II secretion system minor pseudopilin GspK [Desulfuromonadales bacterium]
MRNEKGFALILTLVITALMVAVTTELIHQVYVDTSLSRGFRDGQQGSLLAESGVKVGLKLLQNALSSQTYSSFIEPLKQEDEVGSIEITATEESGKINLNDLVTPQGKPNPFTEKALKLLGKQLNIPEDIWGALADWLDSDDLPSSGGAETPYYQTLKPPYSARNGKLASLTELSLIRGFTFDIIEKLRPFVTVYPTQTVLGGVTQININTASKEVIRALDERISVSMAERVVEERRLRPFKTVADLSTISGFAPIAPGLVGFATTKGIVFRIISQAHVKDSTRVVEAVALLGGEILSWQEY